jgi:hypothetical protein
LIIAQETWDWVMLILNLDFNLPDILPRVICGTPCIGKTFMARKYFNVVDLAGSPYKYLDYDPKLAEQNKGVWKEKNPNWLPGYINDIKKYSEYNIVLLPMFEDLRGGMDNHGIEFAIAYSPISAKEEIRMRYMERGNPAEFIDKVMSKFDAGVLALESDSHIKIPVNPGQYLEQALLEYRTLKYRTKGK